MFAAAIVDYDLHRAWSRSIRRWSYRMGRPRIAVGAGEVEVVVTEEGEHVLGEVGCLERDRCRE